MQDNPNLAPDPRIVAALSIFRGNFSVQAPGIGNSQAGLAAGVNVWTLPSSNDGEQFGFAVQANLANFPSGRFTYSLDSQVGQYTGSAVAGYSTSAVGSVLVVNRQSSPFGTGWDLEGWQQIVPNSDGSALLIDGGGTRILFEAPVTPGGAFISPDGDFSTLVRLGNGTFQRLLPDGTLYAFGTNNQISTVRDSVGNTTRFTYDSSDRLTALTDPAGLTTTLAYTNGLVSSITDPAGRTTQLLHDSAGNLIQIIQPDGAIDQYGYDANHALVSGTDPNGNTTFHRYDFSGRIQEMIGADGSQTQLENVTTHGLYPSSQTTNLLTPAVAAAAVPDTVTIADANGNVVVRSLDDMLQRSSAHDAAGHVLDSQHGLQSLTSRSVDGRGNVTLYTYDANGNLLTERDQLSSSAYLRGSFSSPGAQNNYAFQGDVGQALYLDPIGSTIGVNIELKAPSGELIDTTSAFVLKETGTYTLTVTAASPGSYGLHLVDLAASTAIAAGSKMYGTIDPAFGSDFYQLAGQAGQRLYVHGLGNTYDNLQSDLAPTWTLLGPSGKVLASSDIENDLDVSLPLNGQYTLIVTSFDAQTPLDYGFLPSFPTTSSATLALSAATKFNPTVSGERRLYTFAAQAGQRLVYDALGGSDPGLNVRLRAPDEVVTSLLDQQVFTVGLTGNYTLEVTAKAAGSFSFVLQDLASVPQLTPGAPLSGIIDPATGGMYFRFVGQPGHALKFLGQSLGLADYSGPAINSVQVALYGNSDEAVASALFEDGFSATLPADGEYYLVLSPNNAGAPIRVRFQVNDSAPAAPPVTGFGIQGGSLAAGANATYTFTGPAGLPILLNRQDKESTVEYEIIGPTGLTLYTNDGFSTTDSVAILPVSGTYTIRVSAPGSASDYRFDLLNLEQDSLSLTPGQLISDSVTDPFATTVYQFSAQAGQLFYYDGLDRSDSQATIRFDSLSALPDDNSTSEAQFDTLWRAPWTGTFYLQVSNAQIDPSTYSFELLDVEQADLLTLATPANGVLDPQSQAALYRFNGSKDQAIVILAPDLDVTVWGPNGAAVPPDESGRITLPSSGVYVIVGQGDSSVTTPLSYTLEIKTPSTTSEALSFGALATGIVGPGDQHRYTFNGNIGQQLLLANISGNASLVLTSPSGAEVPLNAFEGGMASAPVTLTEAGAYVLTVKTSQFTSGSDSVDYAFRLWNVAAAPLITAGTQYSGQLQTSSDGFVYRYAGAAGQRVYFDITPGAVGGVAGEGAVSLNYNYVSLTKDGSYVVEVTGITFSPDPLDFSFTLITPTRSTSPLTLGSTVQGALSGLKTQVVYSFQGSRGQRIYFDDLSTSSSSDLSATLTGPDGKEFGSVSLGQSDNLLEQLRVDGAYTVSIESNSAASNNYAFRLLDLANAPLVNFGNAVSGTLDPGASAAVYQLPLSVGQRITFHGTNNPAHAFAWAIITPDGIYQTLGDINSASQDFTFVSSLAGAYTLVADAGALAEPVTYSFQVTDTTPTSVTPAGFGTAVSGTLTPGAQASDTISSPAGRTVYFDNQDGPDSSVVFTLFAPSGDQVFSVSGSDNQGPIVLQESGNYTLKSINSGGSTASYQFRMLDLTALPLMTLGSKIASTLNPGYQSDIYAFQGTVGQQLVFSPSQVANTNVFLISPGPSFDPLGFKTSLVNPLQQTGKYYLNVGAADGNPAAYSFQLFDRATLPAVAEGTVISNSDPGAATPFRITGKAGDRYYFANTGSSSVDSLYPNIIGPDNAKSFAAQAVGNGFLFTLPTDGTYLLASFTDSFDAPVPYAFKASIPTTTQNALTLDTASTGARRYTYDPKFSRTTSSTDELGHQVLDEIDPTTGNLLSETKVIGSVGGDDDLVTRYVYTASGQVSRMTDPAGHVTHFVYDAQQRVIQTIYAEATPVEASTRYEYDAAGNITTQTDENGNKTLFTYDSRNRPIQVRDAVGNVTKYAYDVAGNLIKLTDPRGNVTTFAYDKLNRLIKTTAADGGVTQRKYDNAGNLIQAIDPLGRVTSYRYDVRNRLIEMIDAAGASSRSAYDLDGNLIATVDANGHRSTATFDARSRQISWTDPLGNTTTFQFDTADRLVASTDADGHTTRNSYDDVNRPTATIDALGGVRSTTYDANANPTSWTDPLGRKTTQTYDARDRIVTTTDPLGGTLQMEYDAASNIVAVVDQLGHRTQTAYDADNRITSITDHVDATTQFTYDAAGNRISTTDALGHITQFSFDAKNRWTTMTDAVNQTTKRSFDLAGNLVGMTDALSRTTNYGYDALNRLAKTTDAAGGVWTSAFDAVGNLISATDARGLTTSYAYDAANRLTTTTDALGGVWSASYDGVGNVLTRTDALDRTTQFAYDALNRMISTTDAADGVWGKSYDAVGNVLSDIDALGRTTHYSYDGLNRLISRTDALGSASSRTYDAVGNLVSATDELGRVTQYAYDAQNRLITTTDAAGGIWKRSYDAVGNLKATTDALGRTTQHSYDALNRLVASTDALNGVRAQTYDAVGNIFSTTDEVGDKTQYAYDALNRRVTMTDAAAGVWSTTYDADGNVTSTTDARGHSTAFAFDALNRQVSTTDALGGVRSVIYDAVGNTLSSTDELGRTTTYAYDVLNRRTNVVDAASGVWRTDYDAVGNAIGTTDALGRVTIYSYDALNRLQATADALGGVRSATYDAVGNQTASTDELNHKASFSYDSLNRLVTVVDALGGIASAAYDAVGNKVASTDQLGRTTQMAYDALNRLTRVTDPLANVYVKAYDAAGRMISSTDPLGRITLYAYDALNRLTTTTDPLGGIVAFGYDANSNQISTKDPLGRTSLVTYDALDRPTSTTDPLGNVSTQTYDAASNVITVADALGHNSTFTYDVLNRLTKTLDARTGVSTSTYDADGNQTSFTDAAGNKTAFGYDALDRLTSETNALGAARTYQYDAAGNRVAIIDRDNRMRTFGFDALNRLVEETWLVTGGPPANTLTYSYDAASQLLAASDSSSAYQISYDADGRVSSVSNSGTPGAPTVVMTNAYDAVGNLLSRADTIDAQATLTNGYSYDALDRVTELTQAGPGVSSKRVDIAYDAASQRTTLTRSSDLTGTPIVVTSQYSYDQDGRLVALTHKHGSTTIADDTWTFDAASRIIAASDVDGASSYQYDATDQLTGATHAAQSNESYQYDLNGNRTNAGVQTGPDNRLLSDGVFNYTYDAEGNRTIQTEIATGQVTQYLWDYRNRLIGVIVKNSGGQVLERVAYMYDVFDNRIAKTIDADGDGAAPAQTARFVYAGNEVAYQFDSANTLTHRYFWGTGVDEILADDKGQGAVSWSLADHLGTIRDLVDNSGALIDHIQYDSFGRVVNQTQAIDFLFGYTGQQFDPETGLSYYRARYYDSAVGRFVSQDPASFAAGDSNLYRYVGNNPVCMTDPRGLQGSCGPETEEERQRRLAAAAAAAEAARRVKLQTEENRYLDEQGQRYVKDENGNLEKEVTPEIAEIDKREPFRFDKHLDQDYQDSRPTDPIDPDYNPLYHPERNNISNKEESATQPGNNNPTPWFSYDPRENLVHLPGDIPFSLPDIDPMLKALEEESKALKERAEAVVYAPISAFGYASDLVAALVARGNSVLTGDKTSGQIADHLWQHSILPGAQKAGQGLDSFRNHVTHPAETIDEIRRNIEKTGAQIFAVDTRAAGTVVGTGADLLTATAAAKGLAEGLSGLRGPGAPEKLGAGSGSKRGLGESNESGSGDHGSMTGKGTGGGGENPGIGHDGGGGGEGGGSGLPDSTPPRDGTLRATLRGDGRSLEQLFDTGLARRAPLSERPLDDYVQFGGPGPYISTTENFAAAHSVAQIRAFENFKAAGYDPALDKASIVIVHPGRGINVNLELGAHDHYRQFEIAVHGRDIPREYIVGGFEVNSDGAVGPFVSNPHYNPNHLP
jgi:RHS repeat-associated protein